MLTRTLYSRPLTSIIAYSMQLQREPVKLHFKENFKLAREQISKISTEFQMSKDQARRVFHFYPSVFKPESKQFVDFKQRVEWIKQLEKQNDKLGLGQVLSKLKFESNHLAFTFTKQQFDSLVAAVNKYFTSKAQVETIFTACPNLINPKFETIFQQKLDLLTNYLSLTQEQSMQVFQKSPFLLPASTPKMHSSILVLFRTYNFTKQEIVQLMKQMGQVFLLGGHVLEDIHKLPIKWGLTRQQTKQTFMKHPLLFFNYPYDVMPYKRKILRYLNFTVDMARNMFLSHPQILIWSIRSLEEKALFITNRLNLQLNAKTVELLTFNFNTTLRPRGEILVKSKTIFNNDNILELMKMTEQQLAQKINVPVNKIQQERAKFPASTEMDFRRSTVLKKIGAREKFIKLAQKYQH